MDDKLNGIRNNMEMYREKPAKCVPVKGKCNPQKNI